MQNNFFKIKNLQAGVSLIIAFFVMTIILAIILAITTLLYQEIKMIRNIGGSVVAFYAADSGIEKVLYYDRKVKPEINGVAVSRGLCSMFFDMADNPDGCPSSDEEESGLSDTALFCDSVNIQSNDSEHTGCNPDICSDCTITFKTTFPDNDKTYTISANISPTDDGNNTDLTIDSLGTYKTLIRKIQLYLTKTETEDIITILAAYATPISSEVGSGVQIKVIATADLGISKIEACIKTSPNGGCIEEKELTNSSADTYLVEWISNNAGVGIYYVDITVTDGGGNTLLKENI